MDCKTFKISLKAMIVFFMFIFKKNECCYRKCSFLKYIENCAILKKNVMLRIMRTVTNTCSSGESTAFVTNFRIKRRNITYYLYSNPKVFLSYFMLCNEKKKIFHLEITELVFILWFLAFVFLVFMYDKSILKP